LKFCTHILSVDRNKSPLKISGKVAVGVVRTLEIFQGTHILGASRGRLCDSKAFLFVLDLVQEITTTKRERNVTVISWLSHFVLFSFSLRKITQV